MIHSFDTYVARECGMLEAVILRSIEFWCKKNASNNKNIYNGKAWTYNTIKAFEDLFPEATGKQIRRALESLVSNGYIEVDNFNADKRDRTKWYALTGKYFELLKNGLQTDLCNCPSGNTHLPKRSNATTQEVKSTPYYNTDNILQIDTTDNNTPSLVSTPIVVDTKSPKGSDSVETSMK